MKKPYRFLEWEISADMLEAIALYVERGLPPGGFLEAVICNDFQGACGRADWHNIRNLPAFAAYFYKETPSACNGSVEAYHAWLLSKQSALTPSTEGGEP